MIAGDASPDPAQLKLVNVQALRAVAAAMVVVVHLNPLLRIIGATDVDTGMFAAGVDLFFVISGFIMVYTTRTRSPSPWQFMVGRVARIVPIYWVLTIMVFVAALVSPGFFGGTVARPLDLVRSLLFIPYGRIDGLIRPILFVGWSLDIEMMFYVLFALALPARRWRHPMLIATLVAMVIVHDRFPNRLDPVGAFLTQPMILNFAVGMAIGVGFDRLPQARAAVVAAWFGLPLATIALLGLSRYPFASAVPSTMLPAGAMLLAMLTLERASVRFDHPLAMALGDASYALYLTHPFVTQAVIKAATALRIVTPTTVPVLAAATLALAAATAIVVHRALERPLNRAARNLFRPIA